MRRPLLLSFAAGAAAAAVVCSSVVAIAGEARPERAIDGSAPSLKVAPISFIVGSTIDAVIPFDPEDCDMAAWHTGVPMRLSWSGADGKKAVDHYDVWAVPSSSEPYEVLGDTDLTQLDVVGGNYDSSCGGGSTNTMYRVETTDRSGNGAQVLGDTGAFMGAWQEDGSTVPFVDEATVTTTRTGTWTVANCGCSDAGHTVFSTTAGASATFTVTPARAGQWFAVVMPKGSNRGEVSISVDGGAPVTVDTHAASTQNRVVVWQTQLSRATHSVVVTNLGTAGRSRVDLDAVLVS